MRRRLPYAVALATVLTSFSFAAAAPSHALIVGIGDQQPHMFTHPLWKQLGSERTRLIVPWDAASDPAQVAGVDRWIAAARAARQEIVVAFNLSRGDACPASPCAAPSVASYRRAVKRFHTRWGRFVKVYQPWNESNSRTQPTAGKRGARRVAQYYKALRRIAGRRRIVTGADIQDIGDFVGYTKTFLRAVGRRAPRVMGFHNYTDTNRFRFASTSKFVRALPRRTKVWLTETGALYRFTQQNGTVSLPPSEARTKRSMLHLFRLARRHRRRIERIYIYQWAALASDRFDAGVMNPDGTPRSSYFVLRRHNRYFR